MTQIDNIRFRPTEGRDAAAQVTPTETDIQDERVAEEEGEAPLFVSPPPAPFPRIFPGL